MLIIGVTGAIGAGKSSLSKYLVYLGIPVHSSDKEIHVLLKKDPEIREKILKIWPHVLSRGKIDRKLLSDLALSSPKGLAQLEAIFYPKLIQRQKEFLNKNQYLNKEIVALDVPLLYETGLDRYCHRVILATTSPLLRKKRVLKRKGMTWEKLRAFESRQMDEAQRKRRADYSISCGREKGSALKRVQEIVEILSQENLPPWQGKWPTHLKRSRYDARNRFRH
jgi:dephospho-CoA kinase